MSDLLLSPPWWLYCLVLAFGLILWAGANKQGHSRGRWLGLAVIGLGVLMAIMSFLVETNSQKVTRLSGELVQAVVDSKWNTLSSLLADDATLAIDNSTFLSSRDPIVAAARIGAQRYGLHSANCTVEDLEKQSGGITTTLRIFTTGDLDPGHPLPSRWQLDWIKGAEGRWIVRRIRVLEIGNTKGSDLSSVIPRP
jgi:hypothetical protein